MRPSPNGAPSGRSGATDNRWDRLFAEAQRANLRHRRGTQVVAVVLCLAAMVFGLFPLVDLVGLLIVRSLPVLTGTLFVRGTAGSVPGLASAIWGTLALAGLGFLGAAIIGIGAGIYLADWSSPAVSRATGMVTDLLAGAPSIVIGYAGYLLLVVRFGWGMSLLAGSMALGVLMLPHVVRSTEHALLQVPRDLKEGSLALGVSRMATTHRVALPLAFPAVVTGLLLAFGIGIGETAPLLYTAAFSNEAPHALIHRPVGYLTYVVWTFLRRPGDRSGALAYAAALLLVCAVVALNLGARWLLARRTGAARP